MGAGSENARHTPLMQLQMQKTRKAHPLMRVRVIFVTFYHAVYVISFLELGGGPVFIEDPARPQRECLVPVEEYSMCAYLHSPTCAPYFALRYQSTILGDSRTNADLQTYKLLSLPSMSFGESCRGFTKETASLCMNPAAYTFFDPWN